MLKSLRSRLTVLMVALAALPLLLVGGFLTLNSFNERQDEAHELQNQTAQRLAAEIGNFINARLNTLNLLVEVQGITGFTLDPVQQEDLLEELIAFDPVFEELALLDSNGFEQVRVSSRQLFAQSDLVSRAGREEFQRPIATSESYYGPVERQPDTGEPLMTISTPIKDVRTGDIVAVMVGQLRWRFVWDLLARQTFLPGQDIYVVQEMPEISGGSSEDLVIAHRNPSVVLRNSTFETENLEDFTTGLSGGDVVLADVRLTLGDRELVVIAEQAESEALRAAYWTLYTFLAAIVGTLFLSMIIGYFVLRQISRPLNEVSVAAGQIAAGDLTVQVSERGPSEIRTLSNAFNLMTRRVRSLVTSLEARSRDLQIAAQVAEQSATILDPDRLLPVVVELTKTSFLLYHTHIYLVDATGEYLVLAAGAGEPGRIMKARGHRISSAAERSLVARAARDNKPVVVDDVTAAPDFLPNPLLPDTRSEAAFPVAVGERVLGVLDVQSEQAARFDVDLQAVLVTLSGQIAVALDNARLFSQVERNARHQTAVTAITRQIQQATTLDEVLQTTVRELGKALRLPHAAVELQVRPVETIRSGSAPVE